MLEMTPKAMVFGPKLEHSKNLLYIRFLHISNNSDYCLLSIFKIKQIWFVLIDTIFLILKVNPVPDQFIILKSFFLTNFSEIQEYGN